MDIESSLRPYILEVNSRLEQLLPSSEDEPKLLHEAMRYSCLAPGKRLRPVLTLICAEATGGSQKAALDAACAIEMIHCFSLIHDDLPAIDDDDLRRGRPTCHVKYGEAIALLAGDALFALAFEVISKQASEPTATVECLKTLTHAVGTFGVVGGETIDILSEGKPVDAEMLELIHRRKTASLIAASCEIGAIFGSDPAHRERLREYGESIGLAFQIADDILNETGTPEQLGKAAGSDRERQKATYPAVYGLDASRKKALELVETAIQDVTGLCHQDLLVGLAKYAVERLN
ncbi:MAG: polyprenyl synthetase family protein [Armatimonadetes bacterium]|nr:polyprenyl synthetase family protein [Armatimonadota bacterium]